MVKLLISEGADVDRQDSQGYSPLMKVLLPDYLLSSPYAQSLLSHARTHLLFTALRLVRFVLLLRHAKTVTLASPRY